MKSKAMPKLAGLNPVQIYNMGLKDGKNIGVSIGIEFCDMMHSVNLYNNLEALAKSDKKQKELANIIDSGFADLLLQLAEDTQFVEYLKVKTPEVRAKMGLPEKKFKHF